MLPLLLIALTVGCYDPSTSCGEACALDAPPGPDATLGAEADTWFGQGSGDNAPHPSDPILWVANPSSRVTLLRFDLATAPSGVLASAVLRLWVVNDSRLTPAEVDGLFRALVGPTLAPHVY